MRTWMPNALGAVSALGASARVYRAISLLFALATGATGSSALADPAELESWCLQARQPSSIALCSDPELRELAIQRNHAFEAARARLSVDSYDALLRDQKGWVRSYSTACGINENNSPALPLASQTLECLKRAGRARVEYLWNYVGGATNPIPAKPADALVPAVRTVPRSVPPAPRCQEIGCLSQQLREDMTESEVISTLGYRPDVVTLETCGQQSTRGSWRCKIYRFGSLRVLFRDDDGSWVVTAGSCHRRQCGPRPNPLRPRQAKCIECLLRPLVDLSPSPSPPCRRPARLVPMRPTSKGTIVT
jgi:hypothetical protein